jgi:hypothetical protein
MNAQCEQVEATSAVNRYDIEATRVEQPPVFAFGAFRPPGPRSIFKSLMAHDLSVPLTPGKSDSDRSTTNNLPFAGNAWRQFFRMMQLCSSAQSWITLFRMIASVISGTEQVCGLVDSVGNTRL